MQTDPDSQNSLRHLEELNRVRKTVIPSVNSILIILSAKGMVYDREVIRLKIKMAYPTAAVFFWSTDGSPIGEKCPSKVDLAFDLTGPGQRQSLFFAYRVKSTARFVVGRKAGFFRKRIYDRVFEEAKVSQNALVDPFEAEKKTQTEVFSLAGIALGATAGPGPDLGKKIALKLPPLVRSY